MKNNSLKKQGIGMIAVLTIQYILGMASNLFVQFPNSTNQGLLWEFAWKQVPLALHIVIGTLLLIGSIILFVRSIMSKNKLWIKASSLGLFGILIAGFSGEHFI